jgi:hypothetical protein
VCNRRNVHTSYITTVTYSLSHIVGGDDIKSSQSSDESDGAFLAYMHICTNMCMYMCMYMDMDMYSMYMDMDMVCMYVVHVYFLA